MSGDGKLWSGAEVTSRYDPEVAAAIVNEQASGAACVDGGKLFLEPNRLVEAVQALRDADESDFVFLCNLTAVDHEEWLEVVYHLQSLDRNHLLQVNARVYDREDPSLPSLTGLYHGAHLQEREVYDLFGIRFEGHPDLRRLFLWDGFPGWPLRKDFLQMPGQVRAGLPGFPHEGQENAWPVPGSIPQRPMHPNDPQPPGDLALSEAEGEAAS